jgi:ABC-2 type transport system ATP-binding protein
VCDEVLELVDLGYKREALVTSLSRGMNQRLGLARVLLHDPQVLLLDEPASGLDPRARIEIRGLLKELRSLGKTIMVSSHILPELADICNKIGIIERGELLINTDVEQVIKQVRRQTVLNVCVVSNTEGARRLLSDQPHVEKVEARGDLLVLTLVPDAKEYSGLATLLVQSGYQLTLFKEDELNLETAFMALTKGITA